MAITSSKLFTIDPRTFKVIDINSKRDKHQVEELMPKASNHLVLVEKFKKIPKKKNMVKGPYFDIFREYREEIIPEHWQITDIFLTSYYYDEYENENEKLIVTPYEFITKEQLEYLRNNKKRRGNLK